MMSIPKPGVRSIALGPLTSSFFEIGFWRQKFSKIFLEFFLSVILFCDKKQISDVSHTFTFSVGFFKNKIDLQFTEGSFFNSHQPNSVDFKCKNRVFVSIFVCSPRLESVDSLRNRLSSFALWVRIVVAKPGSIQCLPMCLPIAFNSGAGRLSCKLSCATDTADLHTPDTI